MEGPSEGASAPSIPPSQTIYINNLNEKVKKAALKKALYAAFSQYGRIVDIVAMKTERMRGQAWIVFADVTAATNALKGMQGFPVYEKPMRIQFAKEKSHAIEKLDGTFRPRQKNKRQREEDEEDEPKLPSKRARPADKPAEAAAAVPALPAVQAVPTNKLLVQNLPALPAEMLSAFLKELFGRFPGLQEVRPVEARRLAFVEYSSESSALPALQALHNYVYDGTNALAVTFA